LNESFILLGEQFKPAFFDQVILRPRTGSISFAAGDDSESPSANDQTSKSFPLAGILPLITRTAQQITTGVPNLYLDVIYYHNSKVILNNPQLLAFSTIIYSAWE
jgi:hypothetical protein